MVSDFFSPFRRSWNLELNVLKCCVLFVVFYPLSSLKRMARSAVCTVLLKGVSFSLDAWCLLMGQLLLHICCTKKKSKLLQNISCNNTLGQWRVHVSYTSKTVPFPQLHLQEHFLLQQAEGKHKHDKPTMHSNTPYKRTHFTLLFSWTTTTAMKMRHPMAWHTFRFTVLEE